MSERVSMAEMVTAAMEARLIDLHTAMPGKVHAYDAAKQTVDVIRSSTDTYPMTTAATWPGTLPIIPDVPVGFMRGGGFFASFPLKAGDYVLVIFCERSLGAWRQSGEQGDPGDLEIHGLSGAYAIPCAAPAAGKLAGAHADNLVIGKDGGAQIHIKPSGEIDLYEENAGDFVALAQKVLMELNKLKTHFAVVETVVTGTVINEAGNGGPSALQSALKTAIAGAPYPSPSSVAATKVKAT